MDIFIKVSIYHILIGLLFFVIYYNFANRKNRRGLVWGALIGGLIMICNMLIILPITDNVQLLGIYGLGIIISFLSFIGSIVVLYRLSPLCPNCKGKLSVVQWKSNNCPRCGIFP